MEICLHEMYSKLGVGDVGVEKGDALFTCGLRYTQL